eukprot:UC4_evm3s776
MPTPLPSNSPTVIPTSSPTYEYMPSPAPTEPHFFCEDNDKWASRRSFTDFYGFFYSGTRCSEVSNVAETLGTSPEVVCRELLDENGILAKNACRRMCNNCPTGFPTLLPTLSPSSSPAAPTGIPTTQVPTSPMPSFSPTVVALFCKDDGLWRQESSQSDFYGFFFGGKSCKDIPNVVTGSRNTLTVVCGNMKNNLGALARDACPRTCNSCPTLHPTSHPSSQPTSSPTPCYNIKENPKICDPVRQNPDVVSIEHICSNTIVKIASGESKPFHQECPILCGLCKSPSGMPTLSPTTPYPTLSPTHFPTRGPTPSMSPTLSALHCKDDDTFSSRSDFVSFYGYLYPGSSCSDISTIMKSSLDNLEEVCKGLKNKNDISAFDACPKSCNNCPTLVPTHSPSNIPTSAPTPCYMGERDNPRICKEGLDLNRVCKMMIVDENGQEKRPFRDECPILCGVCAYPSTSPTLAPSSSAPTFSPSLSPTTGPTPIFMPTLSPTPHALFCKDDSSWKSKYRSDTYYGFLYHGFKCEQLPEISKSAQVDLKVVCNSVEGSNDVPANDACPRTCDSCPTLSPTASPSTRPSESPSPCYDIPDNPKVCSEDLKASADIDKICNSSIIKKDGTEMKFFMKCPILCGVCVIPTLPPTQTPTTKAPSASPSQQPSRIPSNSPTRSPTTIPTHNPTKMPTPQPSVFPTSFPTAKPTSNPTRSPSHNPSISPTSCLEMANPFGEFWTKQCSSRDELAFCNVVLAPQMCPKLCGGCLRSDESKSTTESPTSQPRGPTTSPTTHPTLIPLCSVRDESKNQEAMCQHVYDLDAFAFKNSCQTDTQFANVCKKLCGFCRSIPLHACGTGEDPKCQSIAQSLPVGINNIDKLCIMSSLFAAKCPLQCGLCSRHSEAEDYDDQDEDYTTEDYSVSDNRATRNPTPSPSTAVPSSQPSSGPSSRPSTIPSSSPSVKPTSEEEDYDDQDEDYTTEDYSVSDNRATRNPTPSPSTAVPSSQPSSGPSSRPSTIPSSSPSVKPTSEEEDYDDQDEDYTTEDYSVSDNRATRNPTPSPSTAVPSSQPSSGPSSRPSTIPSSSPSVKPTSEEEDYDDQGEDYTTEDYDTTGTPSPRPSAPPSKKPTPGGGDNNKDDSDVTDEPSSEQTSVPSSSPSIKPTSGVEENDNEDEDYTIEDYDTTGTPSPRPSAPPSKKPTPGGGDNNKDDSDVTDEPSSEQTSVPSSSPSIKPTSGVEENDNEDEDYTIEDYDTTGTPSPRPSAPPSKKPTPGGGDNNKDDSDVTDEPSSEQTSVPSSSPSIKPTSSVEENDNEDEDYTIEDYDATEGRFDKPTPRPVASPPSLKPSTSVDPSINETSAISTVAPTVKPCSETQEDLLKQVNCDNTTSDVYKIQECEFIRRFPESISLMCNDIQILSTCSIVCGICPKPSCTIVENKQNLTSNPTFTPSISPTPVMSNDYDYSNEDYDLFDNRQGSSSQSPTSIRTPDPTSSPLNVDATPKPTTTPTHRPTNAMEFGETNDYDYSDTDYASSLDEGGNLTFLPSTAPTIREGSVDQPPKDDTSKDYDYAEDYSQ